MPKQKDKDSRGVLDKLGLLPSPRVVNGIIRYVEARLDIESAWEKQQQKAPGEEIAKKTTAKAPDTTVDLFSRAFDEALLQRLLPRLLFAHEYPDLEKDALLGKLKFELTKKSNPIKMDLCKKFLDQFVQSSKEEEE